MKQSTMNNLKFIRLALLFSFLVNLFLAFYIYKESCICNYKKAILFDEIVKNRLGSDYNGSITNSGFLNAEIKFSHSEKLKSILTEIEKDPNGEIGEIKFFENSGEIIVSIR